MILFGASGHSKSVINIAESIGESIAIIYDDNPRNDKICNIRVKKFSGVVPDEDHLWIIAIGNNSTRKEVTKRLFDRYGILIHKTAGVSHWSTIGEGTVVMAKAIINSYVKVGKHCIINSGAIVEHECTLEDYVHISPNACLGGGVLVREGTHIGIGANVLPGVSIGKWSTIGAGTVVLKDVPDNSIIVGNPGRIIKSG